jgi:hypothetical protein
MGLKDPNRWDTGQSTGRTMSRRVWLSVAAATWLVPKRTRAAQGDDEQPHIVTLSLGGGEIEVQFAPGFDVGVREQALHWVNVSAGAVIDYFGRLPVPQLELLVQPVDGAGVRGGKSFGVPSPLVRIRLGRASGPEAFRSDWILVHELVHLAIPRVAPAHAWLHEGLATYVEALARGRAALISAATVWGGWRRLMPQGQPQPGDRGLDHTPTWARTYWGGALFCLLADVRMRQRGSPTAGLQQALQGVLAAGGDYRVAWTVTRILATADAAIGQSTLSDLYQQMKDSAAAVDLDSLWHELGVERSSLRDDAPLAAVRRAILS